MGRRGPAPKPTALRVLEGNPSKRPLPKREPKAVLGAGECPSHLDARAKTLWKRKVGELAQMGLLAACDAESLADYCSAYSEGVEADLAIQRGDPEFDPPIPPGALTYIAKQGLIPRPEVKIRHTAAMRMLRFAQEFGLTPSARSRIQVGGKQSEEVDDGILS